MEMISFETLSRLNLAGPSDHHRNAESAFPSRVLLTPEGKHAAIRPSHKFGAIVRGVHDNCVVRDAQLVQLVEQLSDVTVMLRHTIRIDTLSGYALCFIRQMGPHVHPRGVKP